MSGLLLLFYWVVLPAIVFLFFRMLWRQTQTNLQKGVLVAAGIFCAMGLIWILGGGAQGRLDRQVKELCAKDGGVKVYETVRLPAEKFDKYSVVRIPSKQDAKPQDEYYIEWDIQYIKKGNPSLWRSHHRIIRRSDQKILGESIMYARGGGDMPGPWHGSSFKCPEPTQEPSLESSVFLKGDAK